MSGAPLRLVSDTTVERRERILERYRYLSLAFHKKDGEAMHAAATCLVDAEDEKRKNASLVLWIQRIRLMGSLQPSQVESASLLLHELGYPLVADDEGREVGA
jgi:hypothetical protein